MSLTVTSSIRINATLTKANALITNGLAAALAVSETFNLVNGTAAGQADRAYFSQSSLSGTTPLNVDLTSLVDVYGDAVAFVKMKLLYFKAATANTQTVNIGNGTNPFIGPFGAAGASVVSLEAGARRWFDNPAGWTVTPATGMILKLVGAGAGTHVVDIVLVGTSA